MICLKKHLKGIILINLVIIAMFILTGCDEPEPIKIGFVGTLTGTGSDLAVGGRRGAELAIDKINSEGGVLDRDIMLVSKDDMDDKDRAVAIVDEFASENIGIVIGHYTSGMMHGAINQVNSLDMLYLSPTVSSDALNQKDDNFIRFVASTKEQAVVLGNVAYHNNHDDFIVIMDGKNKNFNQALYNNFEEALKSFGGGIVGDLEFESIDNRVLEDLDDLLEQTNSKNVFIIAGGLDFANIAQHLYKSSEKTNIYGPLWAHTSDLIRIGGASVEGAYLVGAIDFNCDCEAFQQLRLDYNERYGEEITFAAVYTYEAVMALVTAMEESGATDPKLVKDAIIKIGRFEGLQGDFLIDAYGDNVRDYIVEEIIDGKYHSVD